jgi:hypothetical protein
MSVPPIWRPLFMASLEAANTELLFLINLQNELRQAHAAARAVSAAVSTSAAGGGSPGADEDPTGV